MSLLSSLERTSFKKIFGFTLLAAVVLATPVTVWVSQQETKLASKAKFEKPEVIKPIIKYGNPSPNDPEIKLVWPFLGKPGDAVLIEGKNFGNNPRDKKLTLGSTIVTEEQINRWTPELIEFVVPENAVSSNLKLQVAGKSISWPYLFTVYSVNTEIQVTESNDIVRVLNADAGTKMEIIFADGSKIGSDKLDNTPVPSDKTILTVIVRDKSDKVIPFFVEPEEFNF